MNDNIFNKGQGLYGSPIPSGLNNMKYPENPKIEVPEIYKRDGGSIKGWEAGSENDDLLENVTD